MEQNVIDRTGRSHVASQDEIWFVYFFLGFTLGLCSFSFNDFWSRGNFLEIGYFIVSILFIFTPLWRKVYKTHMEDKASLRKKYAVYYYIIIYSLHLS